MPLKINNFSSSLGTKWLEPHTCLDRTSANGQLDVTGTPALRVHSH